MIEKKSQEIVSSDTIIDVDFILSINKFRFQQQAFAKK